MSKSECPGLLDWTAWKDTQEIAIPTVVPMKTCCCSLNLPKMLRSDILTSNAVKVTRSETLSTRSEMPRCRALSSLPVILSSKHPVHSKFYTVIYDLWYDTVNCDSDIGLWQRVCDSSSGMTAQLKRTVHVCTGILLFHRCCSILSSFIIKFCIDTVLWTIRNSFLFVNLNLTIKSTRPTKFLIPKFLQNFPN